MDNTITVWFMWGYVVYMCAYCLANISKYPVVLPFIAKCPKCVCVYSSECVHSWSWIFVWMCHTRWSRRGSRDQNYAVEPNVRMAGEVEQDWEAVRASSTRNGPSFSGILPTHNTWALYGVSWRKSWVSHWNEFYTTHNPPFDQASFCKQKAQQVWHCKILIIFVESLCL